MLPSFVQLVLGWLMLFPYQVCQSISHPSLGWWPSLPGDVRGMQR